MSTIPNQTEVTITTDNSVMEKVAKYANDEGFTKFFVFNSNRNSDKFGNFVSVESNGFFTTASETGGMFATGVDDAVRLLVEQKDFDATKGKLFDLLERAIEIEKELADEKAQ